MEHVNCSAVVPVGPSDNKTIIFEKMHRGNVSSVNVKVDIYNSMSFDVFVVNRQNMKFNIPRSNIVDRGKLIFVYSWSIASLTREDMKRVTTTDDVSNSVELKAMLDRWDAPEFKRSFSSLRSSEDFFYVIDEETVRRKKSVYIREIDWVVTLPSHVGECVHPYSPGGQLHKTLDQVEHEVKNNGGCGSNFTLSLIIIDNAGRIGPRWIKLHGSVFKIPCIVDPARQDGFYIISDKPVQDNTDHPVRYADYKASEDDLNIPLYKSFQEAELGGDTEAMIKLRTMIEDRKTREMELKAKNDKNEFELTRLVEEKRILEMKAAEATIAHTREMNNLRATMEQERQKALNEQDKFNREREQFEHEKQVLKQKNGAEVIKVFGALIAGVVGLMVIFGKLLAGEKKV